MGIIAEQWSVEQRVQLTVHRATGLRRLCGLIGRDALLGGEALAIPRCRSVHSCFMSRPIDVAFADSEGVVLEVRALAPWRAATCPRAAQVFELRAGEASRLGIAAGTLLIRSPLEEGDQT